MSKTRAMIAIVLACATLCACCDRQRPAKVATPMPPECGKQTADFTGIESWGPEWPPCPHQHYLKESK